MIRTTINNINQWIKNIHMDSLLDSYGYMVICGIVFLSFVFYLFLTNPIFAIYSLIMSYCSWCIGYYFKKEDTTDNIELFREVLKAEKEVNDRFDHIDTIYRPD